VPDERAQVIARIFDELINRGELGSLEELVHPDYVDHGPFGDSHGYEGFRDLLGMFRGAFPDMTVRPVDIVQDGDRAAWRIEGFGTHQGDLPGIPATGKRVTFTGVEMGRLSEDGRAIEHWSGFDMLSILQQLGVVPPLGAPVA
jgi:predicted ester cyclase